ncbi:helix-turn-helix domain-containing protein [Lacipirellula sp.]|uniref:helix-turn-helix domain-containing protein n=1 Tax=Lacipirellula sp. TaxID=2691419 RepID=UPI003D0D4372
MDKQIHSREHKILVSLLRELRMNAGFRQIDMAKKLKRHQSFVSKLELGERRIDVLELREICKAFGTPFLEVVAELDRRLRRA